MPAREALLWAGRTLWQALTWRGWVDVVALLFLAALAMVFHRDLVQTLRIFYENDTTSFYYPLTSRFDQALDDGLLPLWTRSIFAGFPLFADSESGMLYPFNLLLLTLLPAQHGFIAPRIIAFVLAGWFMYGFGRAMGFRPFAAAFAAVAFSYGSFMVGQLHHANVLNSAIWLPAVFLAVEMAFRRTGRRRYQWLALGGLALGLQCLAVHVQVVLITLLAVSLYIGYRALLGPMAVRLAGLPDRRPNVFLRRLQLAGSNVLLIIVNRWFSAGSALVLLCLLGVGVGAVQLLPLYELGQQSYRARVDYGFASSYNLPPLGLLQMVLPYLFLKAPGVWAGTWISWETILYLGMPTLLFALVGALFARNRHTLFFALLTIAGIFLALGPGAPINLHALLWEVPGFSSMRAPGRFSLLVVFAGAALAGWGAQWLDQRLSQKLQALPNQRVHAWRSWSYTVFLGVVGLLPLALTVGVLFGRGWLEANKDDVLKSLAESGMVLANSATAAQGLYDQLALQLTVLQPRTALSIALLQTSVVVLVLWYGAPKLGHVWKGAALGLLSVDLLVFAGGLHPLMFPQDMVRNSQAVAFLKERAGSGVDRVLVRGGVPAMEPNRLMPAGVSVLGGYSSLPQQRHLEYLQPLREALDTFPDVLAQTAAVRYVVASSKFTPMPFYKFVSFDPRQPLTLGVRSNPGGRVAFNGNRVTADTLAVVSALRDAVEIPQGTPIAELTLTSTTGQKRTVVLRAGQQVSEWAYERADVKPAMKHNAAEVALVSRQVDYDRQSYPVNFYYAELPLGGAMTVETIEYRYLHGSGGLRLYGLALVNPKTAAIHQVREKQGYKEIYRDDEAVICEVTSPLPKAYFINRSIERKPDSSILYDMMERSFDPREVVLLEDPAGAGFVRDALVSERPPGLASGQTIKPVFLPATLDRYDATEVKLGYQSAEAGYLVLTDSYYPGWEAYIDGQPTPVYRANYLFRAIRAPAGSHTVEFRFNPQVITLGLSISVASLGAAGAVLFGLELWALARASARGAVRLRLLPRLQAMLPRRPPED